MLDLIRKDRPESVIHEVIWFGENVFGFMSVKVIMQTQFFATIIQKTQVVLPYPMSAYEALSEEDKAKWRMETSF